VVEGIRVLLQDEEIAAALFADGGTMLPDEVA
jgi:hypothetical protein